MSLTIAIPTMDRWDAFLKEQLAVYLNHPRVECVIISDENGNDIEKISWTPEEDFILKILIYKNINIEID